MSTKEEEQAKDRPHKFEIQIDRVHFKVTQEQMTGAELRRLPQPSIGPERDLFEVVPGGSDRKIEDTHAVEMRNGLRFFTAPGKINPGARKEVRRRVARG